MKFDSVKYLTKKKQIHQKTNSSRVTVFYYFTVSALLPIFVFKKSWPNCTPQLYNVQAQIFIDFSAILLAIFSAIFVINFAQFFHVFRTVFWDWTM